MNLECRIENDSCVCLLLFTSCKQHQASDTHDNHYAGSIVQILGVYLFAYLNLVLVVQQQSPNLCLPFCLVATKYVYHELTATCCCLLYQTNSYE